MGSKEFDGGWGRAEIGISKNYFLRREKRKYFCPTATYVRARTEFSAFTLIKCIRGNKKVRKLTEVLNASLRSSRPREQPVGASRSYLGSQKAPRPVLGAVSRREGTAAPNELRRGKSLPAAQRLGREFDPQTVTREESKMNC